MQETRPSETISPGGKSRRIFTGHRRYIWWAVLLIVAGLGLWGYFSFRNRTASTGQILRLTRVARGSIEVTVTGTGTVEPVQRWELTAKTGGDVTAVLVQAGQTVKAGQPLVELSADDAASKVQSAQIDLDQARSTLSQLEQQVAALTVRSDGEGALSGFSLKEGQSVPENYVIGTLTSSNMEVKAYFNASQVKNIAVGQKARVFFPDFLSTVEGTVTHVSQTGQANERGAVLYPVTVQIENKGALLPGLEASVEVDTPQGTMKAPETTKETSYVTHEIRTKASGTVKKVYVSDGDRISNGQVLAELENDSLMNQLESQKLKVQQAETQLSSAQDDLAAQTIKAPVDGTVLSVKVQQGDHVNAGASVVVVADLSSMEVTIPVDEIDAGKIKPGQPAVITADAVPGKQYQGQVSAISLEGKSTNGVATYDTKVSLQGPTELLSGMTCDVEITVASKQDTLILPVEALQTVGNQYSVWLVSDTSTTGTTDNGGTNKRASATVDGSIMSKAKQVQVQVGLMNSRYVEIVDGLKEGDTVVVISTSSSGQSTTTNTRFTRQNFNPGPVRITVPR